MQQHAETIEPEPKPKKKKHLSERILKSAMIYLMEEEEELSDKNKISLIDDSRYEDHTMDFKHPKESEDEEDYSSSEDISNIINKNVGDSVVLMGDFVKKKKIKMPV